MTRRLDFHVLAAWTVFVLLAFIDPLGAVIQRLCNLREPPTILEAALVAGIVYLTLELGTARQLAKEGAKALRMAGRIRRTLFKASRQMSRQAQDLEALSKDLRQTQSALVSTSTEVRDGINLVTDIIAHAPKFAQVTAGLEAATALETIRRLVYSFESYAGAWSLWGADVAKSKSPLAVQAWTRLVEIYMENQVQHLGAGYVFTSSEAYTEMTVQCAEVLRTSISESDRLVVFLVTAMLPDEFYNWPQNEYVRGAQLPEHIAHTWAGSAKYFEAIKDLREKVVLRRCLLVKEEANDSPLLSSVHAAHDLQRLIKVLWVDQPIGVDQIDQLNMSGLFNIFSKQDRVAFAERNRFLDIDNFRFYPIATADELANVSAVLMPRTGFLHSFIDDLHSQREDARYAVLRRGSEWGRWIEDMAADARGRYGEALPEFAFFGTIPKEGQEPAFPNWICGLVGYLYPTTVSMRIRFVAGNNLANMSGPLGKLYVESGSLQELLAP